MAVRKKVAQRTSSTDAIAASLIKTDTDCLVDLVRAYASRPSLLAALETGGRSAARDEAITSQLRELRLARPGIATTFLAAPNGRLLAIDPATPSIVGKDFSFRDWYRGVRRTGDAYVSRAFVSLAAGHPLVVGAAVQVRRR